MARQRKSKLAKLGIDRARIDICVEAQRGSNYSKGTIDFGHPGYEGRFEPVYTIEFQRHRLDREDRVSLYETPAPCFDQGGPWSAFYGGHPDGHRLDARPEGYARLAKILQRVWATIEKHKIAGNCDLAQFAGAVEALGLAVQTRWFYCGKTYESAAELPREATRGAGAAYIEERKRTELREEVRRELLAEQAGAERVSAGEK